MGVLLGDTNGNGTVNASDISQTKARTGQTVGVTNFRNDVTVNNSINASDVSLVKAHSGTSLPAAQTHLSALRREENVQRSTLNVQR